MGLQILSINSPSNTGLDTKQNFKVFPHINATLSLGLPGCLFTCYHLSSIIKCFCAFLPIVPKHRVQVTRSGWFFNSISPKRTEGREQVKEKRYISLNATTSKAASGKFQNLKDKCSWKLFNEWGTSCSRPKSEARTLMYHTKKVSEVFRAPITVHT